ncbi:MAG TPA: hypothetical protein PK637_02860 [Flavobacteriales bacterium]|nr:hypothetical protein [Flavobacteriales bacterium]HRE95676.1 hypothetical protein [Flavobacteriales bacterium]HRJ39147.1 hypothetical protein [Flavobacteriales bacterium]
MNHFFAVLFLLLFNVQINAESNFSFSKDGKMGMVIEGTQLKLFSLPDGTILRNWVLPGFSSYPEPRYAEQFLRGILSPDGTQIVVYFKGSFYNAATWTDEPEFKLYTPSSVNIQAGMEFYCSNKAKHVVTTEIPGSGDQSGSGQCSPGYRVPVMVMRNSAVKSFTERIACVFTSHVAVDEEGNVAAYGDKGMLYYPVNGSSPVQLAGKDVRLIKQSFCMNGNALLVNARVPLNDSLSKLKEERIARELDRQMKNYRDIQPDDISAEVAYLSDRSKKEEWLRFCYPDSVWSLVWIKKTGDGWSKPEPALPPHLYPIAWSTAVSPDGKTIAWVELERGDDGNMIVSKKLQFVQRLENGKWRGPVVVTDMPDHNNHIWLFDQYGVVYHEGKLQLFYFSGKQSGKLKVINMKE